MEEIHQEEKHHPPSTTNFHTLDPSLDLQLCISMPSRQIRKVSKYKDCVEALQWQTAEQKRLTEMEKAYAERVRELTRREMELAQSEFTRARSMSERARKEVERAEELKERAKSSGFMEISCHSCRQRFKP